MCEAGGTLVFQKTGNLHSYHWENTGKRIAGWTSPAVVPRTEVDFAKTGKRIAGCGVAGADTIAGVPTVPPTADVMGEMLGKQRPSRDSRFNRHWKGFMTYLAVMWQSEGRRLIPPPSFQCVDFRSAVSKKTAPDENP